MAGLFDGLKKGVKDLLDKTDIDEKIVETAKGLKDKAVDTFNKVTTSAEKAADAPKDVMSQIKTEVDDQVSQIRSAATGTNSIHDYIQNKYHPETAEAPAAPEVPAVEAPAEAPADEAPVGLQHIVDHAQAAAAKVTDASVRAQEMVGEKLQDISERAQAAYEQVREDIAQTVGDVKADAVETVEAAEASVGDKLEGAAGAIAEAAEKAAGAAEALGADAKALGENVAEAVTEKVEAATEAVEADARALGENVAEAVTDKVEAAVEAAHSTVFEGPTAETLSEVFETRQPDAPAPDHPHEA